MARTTISSLVNKIHRQVNTGYTGAVNFLDATITATVTTLTLEEPDVNTVQRGTLLCIDAELIYVRSYDRSTGIATVRRGFYDSVASVHNAGTLVEVQPRFSQHAVLEAIRAEVGALGPDLYRVDGRVFTTAAGTAALHLPADWSGNYGVINCTRKDADTAPGVWPRINWRYTRLLPGTFDDAPTSTGLVRFIDGVADGSVYVLVALPFLVDEVALNADIVDDVGVPASAIDVIEMGATGRLIGFEEPGRWGRNVQDDTRRATEQPPGSNVQPMQYQQSLYRARRAEEASKLRALYPMVTT